MISDVKGEFDKFSGTITANDDDPKSVEIVATIDAASINTRAEKRDNHLKSPEFLDVAKYPTITFKSVKIEPDGDGKWKVTGNLTLHGVTKPVVLEVTGPSPEVDGNGQPASRRLRHHDHQSPGLRRRVQQNPRFRRVGGWQRRADIDRCRSSQSKVGNHET